MKNYVLGVPTVAFVRTQLYDLCMQLLHEWFSMYPFLICLFVMLTSEVVKHTYEGITKNIWFQFGGMPSTHCAFVTSLMMVVGTYDGIRSTTFAIATVFASIVWYDAAFVRKQVGKQAKALNVLQQLEEFSERVGHSVMEVAGGIAFGGAVTYFLLAWIA